MNQIQRLAVRSVLNRAASPLCLARTSPVRITRAARAQAAPPATRTLATVTPGRRGDDDDDELAHAPPLVLPFKAKKVWPPDFSLLSPQEQLRFEKRYKRRVSILSTRPRWIKMMKLAQLVCITIVVVYGVLFMEWDYGAQPFAGLRTWFWGTLGLLTGRQPAVRKADSGEQHGAR